MYSFMTFVPQNLLFLELAINCESGEFVCRSMPRRSAGDKGGFAYRRNNGTHHMLSTCVVQSTPSSKQSTSMTSTSISLSWIASPWLGVFLVGVAVVYYYSTKTDIPKIKGIPEIPGALPMYCPCSHEVADNSFGHLLQLGDVYSGR